MAYAPLPSTTFPPRADTGGLARGSFLVALAGITLIGFAIRILGIDRSSYWSDELFSVFFIREPLNFLWTRGLVVETTPPLYYTLLKWWVAFAGSNEVAIRSLSTAASTLTIPLVYVLALEFSTRRTALLAATLLAFTPMQVYYAQEARTYALLPLFFAAAMLGALRFARRQDARAARFGLALFTLASVLLIYAHATSVFTVAALDVATLTYLWLRRSGWVPVLRLLAANVVIGVLVIPVLWAIVQQTGRSDLAWIEKPTLVSLVGIADVLIVDPSTPLISFRIASILTLATGLVVVTAAMRSRIGRRGWLFLGGVPALYLVAVVLLSFLSPFLIPRMTLWISVPICVLAAIAVVQARPRWLGWTLAVLLLVCSGLGLRGVYAITPMEKEDWRGVMAEIRGNAQPSDLIVLGPGTNLLGVVFYGGEQFYRDRLASDGLARWHPDGMRGSLVFPYQPAGLSDAREISTQALRAAAKEERRVWLLFNERDWAAFGPDILTALPAQPRIERNYANLVLLRLDW
jgi:4-amino-4-deoxy-L-arabinose transferase-like glycosyltransferase